MKKSIDVSFIILFFGFLLIFNTKKEVSGQSISGNEYFRLLYDGRDDFDNLIEVQFIDPQTKSVYKTVNMASLNPFNHLKFELRDRTSYATFKNYNQYKIQNVRLKDLEIPEGKLVFNKYFDENAWINEVTLLSYHSWELIDSTLVLNFEAWIGNDDAIAASSIFYIYDQFGNLLDEINSMSYNCNEFTITSDRKFFFCTFGGNDSEIGYFDSLGYLIYSVVQKKIIYEEKFDSGYEDIGVRHHGNIVEIGLVYPDSEDKIYYNLNKGLKYKISLPDKVVFSIRKTTDYGIIAINNNVNDTLFFESDFRKEEIK
jgi:hypothetical protein